MYPVSQDTDKNLTVCEQILATYLKKRLRVRALILFYTWCIMNHLFSPLTTVVKK